MKRVNTNEFNFDKFSSKRISFILPTKNRAQSLKKALERLKKLKHENDEVIVVDGGSNDSTIQIIKKNKRIVDKYISESDINPTHAVNKGILLASGIYIKNLSDDDIYFPKAMEQAIGVMEANPDIDILECGGIVYYKTIKKFQIINKKTGINFGKRPEDIFYYGTNGAGLIIRRSSLAKTDIFPLNIASDIVFMFQSIKNGASVKFCRLKLYKMIIDKHNISVRTEVPYELYKIVKKYAPRKYYFLYAFLYFCQHNLLLKTLFYPLVLSWSIHKRRIFVSSDAVKNKRSEWDGEFS